MNIKKILSESKKPLIRSLIIIGVYLTLALTKAFTNITIIDIVVNSVWLNLLFLVITIVNFVWPVPHPKIDVEAVNKIIEDARRRKEQNDRIENMAKF